MNATCPQQTETPAVLDEQPIDFDLLNRGICQDCRVPGTPSLSFHRAADLDYPERATSHPVICPRCRRWLQGSKPTLYGVALRAQKRFVLGRLATARRLR